MNKREEYVERIRSIMPAPGWMAMQCWIEDDGTANFESIPVVGWAVKGYEAVYGENDNVVERRGDDVVLLVRDPNMPFVEAVDNIDENSVNTLTVAIEPSGWTDERKARVEKELRESMQRRVKMQQKKQVATTA